VDSRLHHLLDLRVKKTFFELGEFSPVVQNGSQAIILTDPWVNGTKSAPFDQCENILFFDVLVELALTWIYYSVLPHPGPCCWRDEWMVP